MYRHKMVCVYNGSVYYDTVDCKSDILVCICMDVCAPISYCSETTNIYIYTYNCVLPSTYVSLYGQTYNHSYRV